MTASNDLHEQHPSSNESTADPVASPATIPTPKDEDIEKGLELLKKGLADEALPIYLKVLEKSGPTKENLERLADIYRRLDRRAEALDICDRFVSLMADRPEPWECLGMTRLHFKEEDAAIEALNRAAEVAPENATCQYELGLAYSQAKRPKEAKESYTKAIALKPDYAEAFNNLGIVNQEMEQWEEADRALREAVRLRPTNASAYNNLAIALSEQRKYKESIEYFHRAIALDPDYMVAWNNLANSLRSIGDNQGALDILNRVVQRRPDYAEAYNNLALVQIQMCQITEAMQSFNRALLLRPSYPECRVNRGMKYLLSGDLERGWADYEWRWNTKHLRGRKFKGQKWDGSTLDGKRILLGCEQGLGDTFQFIRYATELKRRGATTIFEGQQELRQILARTRGIDEFVPRGERLPRFDIYAPLLSLPGLMETTLESIPAAVPYIHPDPDIVARWKPRVQSLGGTIRVGIVWQGNPRFGSDGRRSTKLMHFKAISEIPGVKLVALQRGFGSEQVQTVPFEVTTFTGIDEQIDGFLRTAAILQNLDLIIAVDTGVAHLAGAMGLPVWVMIAYANDWRWLTERDDTPWYPTMRLFRQRNPDDWEELFERLTAALRDRIAEPSYTSRSISDDAKKQYEAKLREASECSKRGDLTAARVQLEQASAICPSDWQAYHDLAITHAKRREFDIAIGLFRRAIALAPSKPMAYGNLGLALYDNGQTEEAVTQLRAAIRLGGGIANVHNNLGLALFKLGELPAAESSFLSALRLKSDYAAAHYNLAKLLLVEEKFEHGWLEYEWRAIASNEKERHFRAPRWAGESVKGKTVLLYCDNDMDATLAFVRFAGSLKDGGARLLLECPPPLVEILSKYSCFDEVLPFGQPHPKYDVHSSLQSLPGILRVDASSLQRGLPCLAPQVEKVERWRNELSPVVGLKIGLFSHAETTSGRDGFAKWLLRKLSDIGGVTFVTTRHEAPHNGKRIKQHDRVVEFDIVGSGNERLVELLAVLPHLDLLICPDDIVAHMAGAMKIPATIFVSAANLSPWFSSATRTKWYPTLNVVRQGRGDNWKSAISEISEQLHDLARSTDYDSSSFASAQSSPTNSLHEKATRHLREGQISAGIELLKRIIELEPSFSAAHLDLGVAYTRRGDLQLALDQFRATAELDQRSIVARNNISQVFFDRKEYTEAENFLRQCVEQFPDVYDFKYRYGLTLMMLGRHGEAIEYLQQASRLRPTAVETVRCLGDAMQHENRLDEAIEKYRLALQMKADCRSAIEGLARALIATEQFDGAIQVCDDLLKQDRQNVEGQKNRAIALLGLGDAESAIQSLQQVIYLRARNPWDHFELGKAMLQARKFDHAWLELEWRLRLPTSRRVSVGGHRWIGQPLAEKNILILTEVDDACTLQFLRFAKLARAKGAMITIACEPKLRSLLSRCDFVAQVIDLADPLPQLDYYTFLMSMAIGFQIDAASIPLEIPYLRADQVRLQEYAASLGVCDGPKIGIFADVLQDDRLPLVAESMVCCSVTWVGLRDPASQASALDLPGRWRWLDVPANDLDAMSAAMMQCDIIVASDNVSTHLAAALGLRVIVALPRTDQWLLAAQNGITPWYDKVTILNRSSSSASWLGACIEEIQRQSQIPRDEQAV